MESMATGCGCNDCSSEVLHRHADGFTCAVRIDFLMSLEGGDLTETQACTYVATEYDECGPECHPAQCDGRRAVCGCDTCTPDVLATDAGGFTCGERIDFLQSVAGGGLSEGDACDTTATAFVAECGACHPLTCNVSPAPTSTPTQTPSATPSVEQDVCGCDTCTPDVLATDAGGFTCGERISFLESLGGGGLNETDACRQIATNFPTSCGPFCHPDLCSVNSTLAPTNSNTLAPVATPAPTLSPMASVAPSPPVATFAPTGAPSASSPNATLSPSVSTAPVGMTSSPTTASPVGAATIAPTTAAPVALTSSPTVSPGPTLDCGCPSCTPEVLDTDADGISCGIRILLTGGAIEDACTSVATDFPDVCGPCNPTTCRDTSSPTMSPLPPTPAPIPLTCGCADCTAEVLDQDTGSISCGTRILLLQEEGIPEEEACRSVSIAFPICGVGCNPDTCDTTGTPSLQPSETPSLAPSSGPTIMPTVTRNPTNSPSVAPPCGCFDCTEEVLESLAGTFTCLERIDLLQTPAGQSNSEEFSCRFVGNEFPVVCGGCDPDSCDGRGSEAPTPSPSASPTPMGPVTCGCQDCTADILALEADGLTCGERIDILQTPNLGSQTEEAACFFVAGTFSNCGPACHPDLCDGQAPPTPAPVVPLLCGCLSCTQEILDRDIGSVTCGEKIDFGQTPDGGSLTEDQSCRVAAGEFPGICGPECDPSVCLTL
jgi:hypothetical protein